MKMQELYEGVIAPPVQATMADVHIEDVGEDGWVKVSVKDTKGPMISLIRSIGWKAEHEHFNPFSFKKDKVEKPKNFEVKTKSGLPFKYDKFQANAILIKPTDREMLLKLIMKEIGQFNSEQRKAVKKKETAPERKKAAAKVSAAQYKIKQDELKKKYGKAVDMVRYKQIDGDDGYQYNILVKRPNGWVSIMNGLTQREADYHKKIEMEAIAKKNGWGQYAKAD